MAILTGQTLEAGLKSFQAAWNDGGTWRLAREGALLQGVAIEPDTIITTGSSTENGTEIVNVKFTTQDPGEFNGDINLNTLAYLGLLSIQGSASIKGLHFRSMMKRLPTGRAWNGEIQLAYLRGIGSEFNDQDKNIADIADINNILFGNKLTVWQEILNLTPVGTIEEQEQDVIRKLSDVGSLRKEDIEASLRNAGFDVYVHVNGQDPRAYSGGVPLMTLGDGNAYMGYEDALLGTFESAGDIVVNSINAESDESYLPAITGDMATWRYNFFIGGSVFPSIATVDAAREDEFRRLILEIKPLGMWATLLINYV